MKKEAFKIQEVEPDAKLINRIGRKRPHIKKGDIVEMLKYNIITSNQLATLTGKRPDAIITMTTLKIKGKEIVSGLTRILPFRELDELGKLKSNTKKTFILMDEKALRFLADCNK